VDFVEICNVCTRKAIIKAAKRIFNSDKICRSYCDFYFGVTFLEHSVVVAVVVVVVVVVVTRCQGAARVEILGSKNTLCTTKYQMLCGRICANGVGGFRPIPV